MIKSLDDAIASFEDMGWVKEEKATSTLTQEQQRILFGFEEIVSWVEEHGRVPVLGEGADIFEKMYAVRLDRVFANPEWHDVLADADTAGLLSGAASGPVVLDAPADAPGSLEEIFASLGDSVDADPLFDLTHVASKAERDAASAEETAQREPCPDFAEFESAFALVRDELKIGRRKIIDFANEQEIEAGQFFILKGLTAFVAEKDEVFASASGKKNARLRVVFENGTQSRMLARSLAAELYKRQNAGRRITDPEGQPLMGVADDHRTGWLYVLRSLSDDPWVRQHQMVLHKIGQTSGSVERRIGNAAKEPTYLTAPVEIVARFELENVNRRKLETALHVFFHDARLDVDLIDRWGEPFRPREWFLLSYGVIEEAVHLAIAGNLADYRYKRESAAIVRAV